MLLLLLFCCLAVLFMKWYTSDQIQKLQRKVYGLKQDRRTAKDRHHAAELRQGEAGNELESMEIRIQVMVQLIDDLNARLKTDEKHVAVSEIQ